MQPSSALPFGIVVPIWAFNLATITDAPSIIVRAVVLSDFIECHHSMFVGWIQFQKRFLAVNEWPLYNDGCGGVAYGVFNYHIILADYYCVV